MHIKVLYVSASHLLKVVDAFYGGGFSNKAAGTLLASIPPAMMIDGELNAIAKLTWLSGNHNTAKKRTKTVDNTKSYPLKQTSYHHHWK